jgi:hypothetical protein
VGSQIGASGHDSSGLGGGIAAPGRDSSGAGGCIEGFVRIHAVARFFL